MSSGIRQEPAMQTFWNIFPTKNFSEVVIAAFLSFAILASNSASAATVTAVSHGGDSLTLTFEDDVISTSTTEAIFCNSRQAMVMKAELWMPSMGHGSSPVSLFPQGNGCTAIRNMNFMMRGNWDVRVWLNNNDSGTFAFQVR
jgi:hypothetical protein